MDKMLHSMDKIWYPEDKILHSMDKILYSMDKMLHKNKYTFTFWVRFKYINVFFHGGGRYKTFCIIEGC